MTVRRFAVLVATSAVLALAGCAGNVSASGAAGASGASTEASAPPSINTQPSIKTGPSAGKPTAQGLETISGTVSAGVESGCLILPGAPSHLLVFADPGLRAQAEVGATITVTGRAEPGRLTTCQQGVPFIVTAVRAN